MAGLVPPHLLEQIRAANDIVDVVGAVVPLKRAGANFRGLCPFHREKTPSFNVHPQNQIFKCFGCGKGGDVFTFIREYEGLDFMGAVRRLAERANIPLELENNPAAQQQKHIKEVLWNIHEQITQRWQAVLANDTAGQLARDYLLKRGLSEEAIKLFRIGAAPDSWDDTVNWAKGKGHDLAAVEQAGLIIKKEGTDRYYDRFRGRLIFPICDEQSRVIGFSGRILSGDEKTAKYVNSPETPIFTKGKVFFGLDKSKRPLLDAESAIICEGQLDLIACYMAGVQNVVAPQGTALTPEHARILKRYVEEVVLCFDADNAGQNAAIRSLDPLLTAGLSIRVASIPNGKDPDDFIKQNGGEAFREIIEKAEGFFDWYLKRLCAVNDIRTDKGRVMVLREFGEALAKTRNAVLVDTYAQKAALRLGVSVDAVRVEFKKRRPPPEAHEGDHDFSAEEADPNALAAGSAFEIPTLSAEERQLIRILLSTEEHLDWVAQRLDSQWLSNSFTRQVIELRLRQHQDGRAFHTAAFLDHFTDSPGAHTVLAEILARSEEVGGFLARSPLANAREQLKGILLGLRANYVGSQIQDLKRRIEHPDTAPEEQVRLLAQQNALRALRQQPLD